MKRMGLIVKAVAHEEGKRNQVKVGDVREILAIVSSLIASNPEALETLLRNGIRRNRVRK